MGADATHTWCLIDAREQIDGLSPKTRVAGLSLVARHARLAARQGWGGAAIVADDATLALAREALAREPAPAHLTLEYSNDAPADSSDPADGNEPGGEPRRWVRVSLYAVYTADALRAAAASGSAPEPLVEVREMRDLKRARRALFASIRKNIDQDGVVAYHVMRIFSRLITRLVINTRITPNQVSSTAMLMGIAAALCAAMGTRLGFVLAGSLFWWGTVVDCVDGEIARLRMQGSKLGEWLDSMADEVSTYGLLIGLGVGMMRCGQDAFWVNLAFAGAAVGILVHIKLYSDLHRMGATIDTAQYPWFFGTPSASEESSDLVGHLVRWLSFCFRRDAFVTVVAILLFVDRPHWAATLLAGGSAVVLVMLLVHLGVLALRSGSSRT